MEQQEIPPHLFLIKPHSKVSEALVYHMDVQTGNPLWVFPHSARHDLNDISTVLVPLVIWVLMNQTSTVVELGKFHCGGKDSFCFDSFNNQQIGKIREDAFIHFTSVNESASH